MELSDLELFADSLKAKFSLPGTASPKDQLKPVVPEWQKAKKAPVPFIPPELPWRQIPDWISLYRAGLKHMPPAQAWWNALDWHIDAEAAGYPNSRYPDYDQGSRNLQAALERKLITQKLLKWFYVETQLDSVDLNLPTRTPALPAVKPKPKNIRNIVKPIIHTAVLPDGFDSI